MKRIVILGFMVVSLGVAFAFQNCAGTRNLSTDLQVSQAQVDSQLALLNPSSATVATTASSTALEKFFDIYNNQKGTVYYSEAPSTMGRLANIMPMDFVGLGATTVPTKVYAYFVTAGAQSALLITTDAAATTTAATTATVQTVVVALAGSDGTFDESGFTESVSGSSSSADAATTFTLTSTDTSDGDFNDTFQLKVESAADTDGNSNSLGNILFTLPD